MRRSVRRIVPAALAVAALLAATSPALAIPAFARKYKVSCTTCHAPFPRLKPFGEQFAARGFRMPAGQEPARATVETGDPLLELPRDFPVAVRVEGFAAWNEGAAAEADIEFPYVFKVLSGGPISKSVSYYAYFIIEKGEVEGLEDAYLQVNAPFGAPFDLLFGQFQVSDPLFKRELRLERLDYDVYSTTVGDSQVRLTYDRGLMALATLPGKVDLVVSLVNGNGINDPIADFDRDSYKNPALRVARVFGPARVGLFGYLGKEDGETGEVNRTTYFGPDLVVDFSERLQLNAQYLERRDDDPFFTGIAQDDVVTRGGFAELVFLPRGPEGRWTLTALYNRLVSDDEAAERNRWALAASWLLARNVRVALEGGRDESGGAWGASAGLIAAF